MMKLNEDPYLAENCGLAGSEALLEVGAVPISDLLQPEAAGEALDRYRELARAEDRQVAASFLSSWFGNVAIAHQYTLSVHDAAPDFSLDNLLLHIRRTEEGRTVIDFGVREWRAEAAPADEQQRTAWLVRQWQAFYGEQVRPLMQSLSSASGLPIGQTWGQWPSRFFREIYWLCEANKDSLLSQRLQEDYRLLREADAIRIFGQRRNPFAVRIHRLKPLVPGRLTVMKSACCQFHRVEGHDYCYTCPRLKPEQREREYEQYITKFGLR
ncbi:hypothetical protein B9G55_22195 [Saccharibacillus sp. O16]|nr:hypothetical protein B9G55_22195 [Saccharibacillus sp. O16]